MGKRSGTKKTPKVRDLSARNTERAKGGSFLSSVVSQTVKSLGGGVATAARKG